MRRFIAVPVLVFCLIAAGCSSDSDGSTSDSTSTTMEAETTTTTAAYPGTKVMFVGNSFTFHRGNQEQVYDPADKEQPEGEEPDNPCYLLAVIETVRPHEAEYPQQVAHQDRVCVLFL